MFLSSPPTLHHVTSEEVTALYAEGKIKDWIGMTVNESAILQGPNSSALAIRKEDGYIHVVYSPKAFGLEGRNAEQRMSLDLLLDTNIPIVSLGGLAGTGKSLLALAAAIESVVERKEYKRILVFRPLHSVGGEDLGFLPGDFDEKMDPWRQAVWDALDAFCDQVTIDYIVDNEVLDVLPLTHLRGRTLSDAYIIIDEAQNLDLTTLVTALTRVGEGSKVVLTHDVNQRDNRSVGRLDGVLTVVERLYGEPLFAHMVLYKVERSAVARLVGEKFQDL